MPLSGEHRSGASNLTTPGSHFLGNTSTLGTAAADSLSACRSCRPASGVCAVPRPRQRNAGPPQHPRQPPRRTTTRAPASLCAIHPNHRGSCLLRLALSAERRSCTCYHFMLGLLRGFTNPFFGFSAGLPCFAVHVVPSKFRLAVLHAVDVVEFLGDISEDL